MHLGVLLNKFITFGLICFAPRMSFSNSSSIAKSALRKKMKTIIAAIPTELKQLQSEAVFSLLKTLPEFKKSSRISVYLNMDDEIRTNTIVDHIFQAGKKCFIPRYSKTDMDMVRLKSMEDLSSLPKTKWNIAQPLETDQRENALETGSIQTSYLITFTSFQEFPQKPSEVHGALNNLEIGMLQDDNILLISDENGGLDLVIVPGLAFSKSGDRLGRGKGYYDRFLSKCRENNKNLCTVALAFKEQITENIPTDAHDTKIDMVLFSDDVYREAILVK